MADYKEVMTELRGVIDDGYVYAKCEYVQKVCKHAIELISQQKKEIDDLKSEIGWTKDYYYQQEINSRPQEMGCW